jgi:hypothetical protein
LKTYLVIELGGHWTEAAATWINASVMPGNSNGNSSTDGGTYSEPYWSAAEFEGCK